MQIKYRNSVCMQCLMCVYVQQLLIIEGSCVAIGDAGLGSNEVHYIVTILRYFCEYLCE